LLHVLTGRTLAEKQTAKPRIGFCRTPRWRDADAETQASLERAAQQLARAGARVSDFELPPGSQALFDRHSSVMGYESARALAFEYLRFPDQISNTLRPRIEKGWSVTREEYDEVRGIARNCRRQLADQLREFDFLLTPSASGAAPASLASTGDPVFNRAWTLFGVPCVTLPFGKAANGLPLGVQLVGAMDQDMKLLAWAQWAEHGLHR
jgi:Asp-tRNA(Asn)/Glu-tRNA(Gln) amidotransferase A subunit family amidase